MANTSFTETLVPLALISAPVAMAFGDGGGPPESARVAETRMLASAPRSLTTPRTATSATVSGTAYTFGTWNLEHFKDGKRRGFPESTNGGASIPPRGDDDFEFMASVIREKLDAKLLALQEVAATTVEEEGERDVRSTEVERLIGHLGDSWDYTIAESGGAQHLALLFDTQAVQLNAACETNFPQERIQSKAVFDRQPLYAHVSLLKDGEVQNDLAVVAVHLASGQNNNRNHDAAMRLLLNELVEAQAQNFCIPPGEQDFIIMGDFNANRFDTKIEEFWDEMEQGGWDVLADNQDEYSPTRLSGVPLGLRNSRIDYIIVSQRPGGLQGEEVQTNLARVHTELIDNDADAFRSRASDHLPVTIDVHLATDND